MIGRAHHVVYDSADPRRLATFYSTLLGLPIVYETDDWVVVAENDRSSGYAFQRAPDHEPPHWPDPHRPQQVHLDVMVDDVHRATTAAVEIGARVLSVPDHILADPAGHPFCLIPRPGWAEPIGQAD